MIEFLSNPDWIKPQTDFLLFLQNIRINNPEILDKLFLAITVFGEYWLPTLICGIIYWCIDFKFGIYLFSLCGFNILFAHLSKMIACVYRPWILDSNIQPSKLAFTHAKGYSFPSGHSAMSSSVLGGLAYYFRQRKCICLSFIFLILLVGFSRLWLGVHTPQDVICGFLIGFTLVFVLNPIIKWAEEDKYRYLFLLIITDILAFCALIYIYYFNTYRMDYVQGEILVNPQTQKYITAILYGYALGLINGCYLCRFFTPFNPTELPLKHRVPIAIIGAIVIILLVKPTIAYFMTNIITAKIAMPSMFITGMIVTFIYPMIFLKISQAWTHNVSK